MTGCAGVPTEGARCGFPARAPLGAGEHLPQAGQSEPDPGHVRGRETDSAGHVPPMGSEIPEPLCPGHPDRDSGETPRPSPPARSTSHDHQPSTGFGRAIPSSARRLARLAQRVGPAQRPDGGAAGAAAVATTSAGVAWSRGVADGGGIDGVRRWTSPAASSPPWPFPSPSTSKTATRASPAGSRPPSTRSSRAAPWVSTSRTPTPAVW